MIAKRYGQAAQSWVYACVLALSVGCGTEAAVAPAGGPDDAADAADASAVDAAADVTAATDVAVDPCPGGLGCACEQDGDCDDGDACTTLQRCVDNACTAGTPACDDGNTCTADACAKDGTCTHSASPGFCEDGTPCTVADTCHAGACTPGGPKGCDDDEPCTTDQCDTAIGCIHMATDVTCTDATICTEPGYCHLGHCQDAAVKPCDDGLPCTWDTCMPEQGCTSLTLDLASPCTDTVHGGACWKAVPAAITWPAARSACQAWGGELAGVHSLPDNGFVRGLVDGACGQTGAWLGYSDHMQEGRWRWTDTHPRGFSNWADGEPNDAGGVEDYALVGTDGRWNDLAGDVTAACFVCARPLAIPCANSDACALSTCSASACLPTTATVSCDDGNACTADACIPQTGCSHVPVAEGAPCGIGTCDVSGICQGPAAPVPVPLHCAAILANAPTASDGVYWIDSDGTGPSAPYQTWCDMHSAGGGWTLAMKANGNDAKFGWSGSVWTEATAFSTTPLLDQTAAVFPAAWQVKVQAVRVGLYDGAWRWLDLPVDATSLQAIFVTGQPVTTGAGMPAWEALMSDGSLQNHCQVEGFNVTGGSTSIRVGILGNNESDCNTPDSWIGLGGSASICNIPATLTCGDVACYGGDNGDRKTAVYGAIFVR